MAWCRQATSHYQSQCWPRSLSPYGVIRPSWVKHNFKTKTLTNHHDVLLMLNCNMFCSVFDRHYNTNRSCQNCDYSVKTTSSSEFSNMQFPQQFSRNDIYFYQKYCTLEILYKVIYCLWLSHQTWYCFWLLICKMTYYSLRMGPVNNSINSGGMNWKYILDH